MQQHTPTAALAPDATESLAALETMMPMAWMDAGWFQDLSQMNRDIMAFSVDRVRENIKAQQALMQCRSLSDVQCVQADFVQTALTQYQAETGKLVAMSGEIVARLHNRAAH